MKRRLWSRFRVHQPVAAEITASLVDELVQIRAGYPCVPLVEQCSQFVVHLCHRRDGIRNARLIAVTRLRRPHRGLARRLLRDRDVISERTINTKLILATPTGRARIATRKIVVHVAVVRGHGAHRTVISLAGQRRADHRQPQPAAERVNLLLGCLQVGHPVRVP